VENLWVVGAPPQTPLGSCPLLKKPIPAGVDFWPFGPHLAVFPAVFIPPMLRGLDKHSRQSIMDSAEARVDEDIGADS